MFANRVLVVVVSSAAFACAPARADEKLMVPPTPPLGLKDARAAKTVVARIPLTILDCGEAATAIARNRPGGAVLVPLPKEDALIVYASEKEMAEIEALLRLLGEPEKAPAAKTPKKPAVIPISTALDLDEVTKSIRKLFPAGTVIVPLPDEHALLVYVTEADAKEIRQLASPLVEKAPATKPMVPPMPPRVSKPMPPK